MLKSNDRRLRELAERLVASGPKARAVAASECHEISEGLIDALDANTLLRGGVERYLLNTVDVRPEDAPTVLEGLRKSLHFLLTRAPGPRS